MAKRARGGGVARAAAATITMLALTWSLARAQEASRDVHGGVQDTRGRAVREADVLVVVKSWDGGYQQRAHHARTDRRGRFHLESVLPATGRYGVNVAVVADDHAFASRYVFRAQGGALEALELALPPSRPVTLRFLDGAGEPVAGVRVRPVRRKDGGGAEHLVYAQGAEPVAERTDAAGEVVVPWFAPGDEATVAYAPPSGEGGEHLFAVGDEGDAVVEIRVEAPPALATRAAGGNPRMRYVLHEARGATPEAGRGLLLVLPGGDGGEGFAPFVRRIHEHAVPEGVATAHLVAPRWSPDQRIVWPTERSPTEGMGFSTEAFVAAVVEDVAARHPLDPDRIWILAWSSGGPAAYAASLAEDGPVQGAFVAMSVFKPDLLPPLERAEGRAYYLLHAEDDAVCPFRMAREAEQALAGAGARVTLVTYEGGHGWRGPVFDLLRRGLAWLDDA